MIFTNVVKHCATGRIEYTGFAENCREEARRLNSQHQTDEYVVRPYAEKADKR